jgi:hypothetical protein
MSRSHRRQSRLLLRRVLPMSGEDCAYKYPDAPLVSAYTVIGAQHQRHDSPCQDAVFFRRDGEKGVVALALADGHSSSPCSKRGARLAVEIATELLLLFYEELPPKRDLALVYRLALEPLRRKIAQEWTATVKQISEKEERTVRDFGTTLLVALASPAFLLLGQLGDGDILLMENNRVVHLFHDQPRPLGEETHSLCQREAWWEMSFAIRPPPSPRSLLLLSTDGYANSYENDEIFRMIAYDYLALIKEYDFFRVSRQVPLFLREVSDTGSGDDIGLGLLYFPAGYSGGQLKMEQQRTQSSKEQFTTETRAKEHDLLSIESRCNYENL